MFMENERVLDLLRSLFVTKTNKEKGQTETKVSFSK